MLALLFAGVGIADPTSLVLLENVVRRGVGVVKSLLLLALELGRTKLSSSRTLSSPSSMLSSSRSS
jgi:hypothetical protein